MPRSSLASILSSDSTYPKSSYQPSTRSPQRSNSRRRSVIPTTSSSTSTPRSQQQQQYHHHHHHPSQSQSYWDKDDLDTLKELLEIGERAKWKFISTELTRERNKRITAVASQKKFKDMFGVAEASSALGSSLCYVVTKWLVLLDQSKPLSTSAMQSTYQKIYSLIYTIHRKINEQHLYGSCVVSLQLSIIIIINFFYYYYYNFFITILIIMFCS